MLFLNLAIRGYPFGLRAGKDPRSPKIAIDGSFEKVCYLIYLYSILNLAYAVIIHHCPFIFK